MYRPDDKDIDRLSREAAEHYHAPGTPSWETLRQTLEKELPQEKEKKRRGFLFFFLLLAGLTLAGSGIWYGIHTTNSKASQPTITKNNPYQSKQAASQSANTDKTVTTKSAELPLQMPDKTNVNDVNKPADASDKVITPTKAKRIRTDASVAPTSAFSSTAGNKQVPQREAFANDHNRLIKSKNNFNPQLTTASTVKGSIHTTSANDRNVVTAGKNHIYRKQQLAKDNSNQTTASSDLTATESGTDHKNTDKVDEVVAATPVTTTIDSANSKQAQVADIPQKKNTSPVQNLDTAKPTTAKPKKSTDSEKAILFGLTAGFDFSTVKFTYGSNAGYNFGVITGYQFNKHWAVLTGIVYTKKNYKLNGTDYHPPKHDWTQYVNLQKVDGFCRMWEIPVNARYTFNPAAKNIFFAAAGLSSYFMKKQQYDYYYKNSMGMSMVAPWKNDSTFNHIFSILDLSVGLQKTAGKHLDLLIEPYAKIPLGGVGFGNIRLSSFGVNLAVQYKKGLKR